jgi:nicotinic acid mononucleotide adenylyltransferase
LRTNNQTDGGMQTFPLATYNSVSYNDIARNGHGDPFLVRQANLVLNDPYYSLMYARMLPELGHMDTVKKLIEAGCFDDFVESRIKYPKHFLSAPYSQVKSLHDSAQQRDDKTRKAIIISTGSYDPLHDGHLETVGLAKKHIEDMGNNKVIAGFVSSSHDTYVRRKNPGGVVDYQRVHNNVIFAESSKNNQPVQWIFHDNWETLGINHSLNFTDLICYVSQMVETYVAQDIDIYYVFGSDNAGFAMTFAHGRQDLAKAICIGRPGYFLSEEIAKLISSDPNLSFIQGNNPISSTLVRSRQTTPVLVDAYTQPLIVKNDIKESTKWLEHFFSPEDIKMKQKEFLTELDCELLKSFSTVLYVDEPQRVVQKDSNTSMVNAADFLVGAFDSGLLIDAETSCRAPYMTPFVDLIARVNMPADNIRSFSKIMWTANKKFYSDTGITVADLDAVQISFPSYLQFDKDTEVETICGIYAEIFTP